MSIGNLRHRIEIQHYINTENEIGEDVKLWQTYAKVWSKIDCVGNGRQQLLQEKEVLSLNYEIVIRYRKDIDTKMRVKFGEKIFNINHVVNYKELNKELHLFCILQEEGVYNE